MLFVNFAEIFITITLDRPNFMIGKDLIGAGKPIFLETPLLCSLVYVDTSVTAQSIKSDDVVGGINTGKYIPSTFNKLNIL